MTFKLLPESQWWVGAKFPPRDWQRENLPLAIDAIIEQKPALGCAVMGAGKSSFLAEICRSLPPAKKNTRIVISTPTEALVDQLTETISLRLRRNVSRYYGRLKSIKHPWIVVCNPSIPILAKTLKKNGLRVVLWIIDEAHNSECKTLVEGAEALKPLSVFGLTATPRRRDKAEVLSLFSEALFEYTAADAIADGIVVPWEIRQWQGAEVDVDEACIAMIKQAIADGYGGGVCDAGGYDPVLKQHIPGIKDAEAFAERLKTEGLRAEAVHSKLDKKLVKTRLSQLQRGDLDVVVHVAMLKEGVDMPWLKWLCMRRRVKSPVWFSQHVGRALRAYKGKDKAIILDPHDLFSMHKITLEMALGGGYEPDKKMDVPNKDAPKLRKKGGATAEGFTQGKVRGIGDLSMGVRHITSVLEQAGVLRLKDEFRTGRWRHEPVTDSQLLAIKKNAPALATVEGIPPRVKTAIKDIYQQSPSLSCGDASDFLAIILALTKAGRWSDNASRLMGVGQ